MTNDETIPPPDPDALPSATSLDPVPHAVPGRIGRYEIKRLIQTGGMGAVYLAVQEHPRRTVALKVMRAGMSSRAALRRFEYESQLLGRLRHPGIAQIFEAGTHNEGAGPVPYFAMEYVADARWLCDYAEHKRLNSTDRLELFCHVCDAMQHAHQKGIIHRDLKPANILVDPTGQPKIIDFGVARGADSDMAGVTLQTNVGQLIGTIQYMSPEQCGADPHGVDVRSDVYTLGVILYELLTTKLPYDISSKSVPDAARTICDAAPVRPSSINISLRGDLETIVLKALEKDRDRRYQSVSDLAGDIGRFVRNEPILARRIGPFGRLAKWARRNRQATVIGSAAAILLVLVSSFALIRVVSSRREAQLNVKAANQSFELVRDMLRFKDPSGESFVKGAEVQAFAERVLDEAAQSLSSRKLQFPATEADFREILGVSYTALGQVKKAKENLTRTLEIRRHLYGENNDSVANALHSLGAAMFQNGEYEDAYKLYQQSYAIRRKLHTGDDPVLAFSMTHVAACEMKFGRFGDAEQLYRQALDMRRRLYPGDHEDVAASLNNLAKLYVELENYASAEPLFRQSLEMIRGLKGPDAILVSHAQHNLAGCLLDSGRFAEALRRYDEALDIRQKYDGLQSQRVASSLMGKARAQLAAGDIPGAESSAKTALDICRLRLRESHPDTADASEILGMALTAAGRPAEAEPLLRDAVQISQNSPRPVPADLALKRVHLATCLAALHHYDQAEPLLQQSLAALREARGESSQKTAAAAVELAKLYDATGRANLAQELRGRIAATGRNSTPASR